MAGASLPAATAQHSLLKQGPAQPHTSASQVPGTNLETGGSLARRGGVHMGELLLGGRGRVG